jgi:hypothetical protein
LAGVAATGDIRATLEALRDRLASAFDAADVNIKPQISGQLRATLADIAGLPEVVVKLSQADELRAKRAAKRSA